MSEPLWTSGPPQGPRGECGCGFKVSGLSGEDTAYVMNLHRCPEADEFSDGFRWYHAVFSLPGLAVVAIIAYVILRIFGVDL
jgi:hypothetical protein